MKRLLLLLALAPALLTAGLRLDFATPIDIAGYNSAGGIAVAADIISRDYETGEIRFRLLNAQGQPMAGGAVFGLILADPDCTDAAAKAAIAAEINKTP